MVSNFTPRCGKILRHEWDPIGIKKVPAAHDEYEDYVGPIVRRIIDGTTLDQLSNYLISIESGVMGLSAVGVRARAVANAFLS